MSVPSVFRLLKPYRAAPLPDFERREISDIPPASVLLFYGGTKVTELVGNRMYRHPFAPPAFHASLYLGRGEHLNVGKWKTLEDVEPDFTEKRRVDAIIYSMESELREEIVRDAIRDQSKPKSGIRVTDYGITDFLRFGIPWWKPSRKDICSENCVELMEGRGVKISALSSYRTAPWHLFEFALFSPECKIFTVWVGNKFTC